MGSGGQTFPRPAKSAVFTINSEWIAHAQNNFLSGFRSRDAELDSDGTGPEMFRSTGWWSYPRGVQEVRSLYL
jgi:hypothetical protein